SLIGVRALASFSFSLSLDFRWKKTFIYIYCTTPLAQKKLLYFLLIIIIITTKNTCVSCNKLMGAFGAVYTLGFGHIKRLSTYIRKYICFWGFNEYAILLLSSYDIKINFDKMLISYSMHRTFFLHFKRNRLYMILLLDISTWQAVVLTSQIPENTG
ncbi:hypothetical protein ACJX0J_011635, partial [Zea mays]